MKRAYTELLLLLLTAAGCTSPERTPAGRRETPLPHGCPGDLLALVGSARNRAQMLRLPEGSFGARDQARLDAAIRGGYHLDLTRRVPDLADVRDPAVFVAHDRAVSFVRDLFFLNHNPSGVTTDSTAALAKRYGAVRALRPTRNEDPGLRAFAFAPTYRFREGDFGISVTPTKFLDDDAIVQKIEILISDLPAFRAGRPRVFAFERFEGLVPGERFRYGGETFNAEHTENCLTCHHGERLARHDTLPEEFFEDFGVPSP